MTTPYLDEAERCTRVGLMSDGGLLRVDDPTRLKTSMRGEVVEVVCEPVRPAFAILKGQPSVREVQLFGDRLNVVIDDAGRDMPALATLLQSSGIAIRSQRRVVPSLENVFISLLTHPHSEMVAS